MSPPPPYSVGKPSPVAPVLAISLTSSRTRSRNSSPRHLDRVVEDAGVLREVLAGQLPDLGVLAVEQRREGGDVDVGQLAVGHGATLPYRAAGSSREPRTGPGSPLGSHRDVNRRAAHGRATKSGYQL